ncbi:hypothetical protein NDU88_002562 [Pleurodeles waltl]|uniref:Uncharacterized protein n=1 Tax=Pleurodeles waltl TaxID=8319 RepID=A0AAV7LCU9_PLEWA|nr:hypothetical protein NDU88_002562 [Pleurodeles waltl]
MYLWVGGWNKAPLAQGLLTQPRALSPQLRSRAQSHSSTTLGSTSYTTPRSGPGAGRRTPLTGAPPSPPSPRDSSEDLCLHTRAPQGPPLTAYDPGLLWGGWREGRQGSQVAPEGLQRLPTELDQSSQSPTASPSPTSHHLHGARLARVPLLPSNRATTVSASTPGASGSLLSLSSPISLPPSVHQARQQSSRLWGPASFATTAVPTAAPTTPWASGSPFPPGRPWSQDPPGEAQPGRGPCSASSAATSFRGGLWQNPGFGAGKSQIFLPTLRPTPNPGRSMDHKERSGGPDCQALVRRHRGSLTSSEGPPGSRHAPPKSAAALSSPKGRATAASPMRLRKACRNSLRERSPPTAPLQLLLPGIGSPAAPSLPRHPRVRGRALGHRDSGPLAGG